MGLRTGFSRFQAPPEMLRGELTGTLRRPRLSKATWRLEKSGAAIWLPPWLMKRVPKPPGWIDTRQDDLPLILCDQGVSLVTSAPALEGFVITNTNGAPRLEGR